MNDKVTLSTFQIFQKFPDQESARKYLESRLWPNGVKCPFCGKLENITTRKNGFYRCNNCGQDFTVRTGTIVDADVIDAVKICVERFAFGTDHAATFLNSGSKLSLHSARNSAVSLTIRFFFRFTSANHFLVRTPLLIMIFLNNVGVPCAEMGP